MTSFVGRRRELAAVRKMLSSSRLVTLVGVGGVGKTRLAVRAAREMRRAFSDGVCFVEFDTLTDPGMVPPTVARALGLREEAFGATDRLVGYLEDKSLLLVLDNCEHLADVCAAFAGKVLAGGPQLRMLVTSRHRLGAEGEQLLLVEPLVVPADEQSAERAGAEQDVLTLFADRAAAVAPDFELADNRATVARVCRRLDGLPLAIELAAVWMRMLSVEQILEQLDDRFAMLTTGNRTALPRQQRLEALIEWSFRLCSEPEQVLWSRLGVFRGGFDLSAAEEVCAFGEIDRSQVLELVAGLVDKSVLTRQSETYGRTARYRMLSTIQEYACARLPVHELAGIRARHFDYYAGMARDYRASEFTEAQQDRALRMRGELDNIREAVAFGLEAGAADQVLACVADLADFWVAAGLLADGHRWLERALTAHTESNAVRARALRGCITVGLWLGDHHGLRARLTELQDLARDLADPAIEFEAQACRGLASFFVGDLPDAQRHLESALADRPSEVDPGTLAHALQNLCMVRFLLGAPDAERVGQESLDVCVAHGRPQWPTAHSLMVLGFACWQRETRRATELQREAIRLRVPVADHSGIALSLEAMAWCAAGERQFERAATLLGSAGTLWRRGGAGSISPMLGRISDDHARIPGREALGEAEWEKVVSDGAAFTLEQAVAFALSDKKPSRGRLPNDRLIPELTRRENEIAGLVADGLGNKEIATRLVISQRTAETHVEHILSKLGFTSRTQIASWIAERRSDSPR